MLNTMKLVAEDVRGLAIPDVGHFVLEGSPSEVVQALLSFARAEHQKQ